jgi:hypothetical protein
MRTLPARASVPSSIPALGDLPASQSLHLSLSLPIRNSQQLQVFLHQVNQPGSPNYHQFLSPQQFTETYGPSADDYAKVVAFAKANGLNVTRTFANRMLVNVTGTTASVNRAFHVTMRSYQHPTEKRTFYAPDAEPAVDAGVPILNVQGLSTLNLPHPMLKKATKSELAQSFTTGSGSGGEFLGSDMRAAYAPGVSLDGTGQTVGLVELGPYNLSDVQRYFSSIGQPLNVPIYNVLLDVDGECIGTSVTKGCDDGEEVIDMEQAISMAPHLSSLIIYEAYGSGSDALTAFTQAASDDVAKQISLSFGWGGTPASEPGYEQIFMELAAQGQNVFVSSGDSGANPGGVGYPGNSPNITAVGGTDLTTTGPGGSWQSETAWVGSGGGWSTSSPIPSYQVSAINSTNQGSAQFRDIPDVAMEANTDNYFCANGSCDGGIGGTSLAAPRWAGYLALANQQANGASVGFLNPTVYSLGQQSTYTTLFHDITEGNDFNSSSPDLFSATVGYDLTTGWGSPSGQNMLDVLSPAQPTAANFSLTPTSSAIRLLPGESGSASISVTPVNGFKSSVELTASVIGSPSGVVATLSESTVTGAGAVALNVSTTSQTVGANYLVAVNGVGGGVSHTAYVNLALPLFTVSATPSTLYLNQRGVTTSTVTVTPQNGFNKIVHLSALTGLPEGVYATFRPEAVTSGTSTMTLFATPTAATGVNTAVTVSATSGTTTELAPSAALSVSAAVGGLGFGVPVDLSSFFNLNAVYSDGSTYSNGGLDGDGYSYSATLLTKARTLDNIAFSFGPANAPNALYAAGQAINLPARCFDALHLLATGIQGEQAAQSIVVTYTDGTTSTFTQSFSDWYSPSGNRNETEAVAMAYRNISTGKSDERQFNLYGYTFVLDSSKIVKSLTLPNNRNIVILAATLAEQDLGNPVDLSSSFNAAGIYTDSTTFSSDGGIDAGGTSYSANLLEDLDGQASLIVHDIRFQLAAPNINNVVYGTGTPIELPAGHYANLQMIGTGVQGSQTAQTIVITYTDGTRSIFTQSFSDWYSPQGFDREQIALPMSYRDNYDGTQDAQTFNLYRYTFPLKIEKSVKSITLPNNRDVVTLGITLTRLDFLGGGFAPRNPAGPEPFRSGHK